MTVNTTLVFVEIPVRTFDWQMARDVTDRDRKGNDIIVTLSDHVGGRVAGAPCDQGKIVCVHHSCIRIEKKHSLQDSDNIYSASQRQTLVDMVPVSIRM